MAAALWERTGSFSETPSEMATPLRQLLKMVCVHMLLESFPVDRLIWI